MVNIDFPPLVFTDRCREFNDYDDSERAAVVYGWLVDGKTTRALDTECLGLDGTASHGYQSFGILHYLGLGGPHQGLFRNISKLDMMLFLQEKAMDPHFCLIYHYLHDYFEFHGTLEEIPLPPADDSIYPEDDLKGQTWITSTLVKDAERKTPEGIDMLLKELPDKSHRIVIRNRSICYSSREVKAAVKSLYDYKCQCCGDTIYRRGWQNTLSREEQWLHMSADVHHIRPLSQGGPDLKSNMVCLCPNCHRKFHSGQFRLLSKGSTLTVRDELFAKSEYPLNTKHGIVLY